MLRDFVEKNRSYRRFEESYKITEDTLKDLVNLARMSPSAANLQPLKYILSNDTKTNAKIFPNLAWAGYLKDWKGPSEGERPAAYIIILGDKELASNFGCDSGIACQSILLGAVEKGLGGCIIGSVDRDKLRKTLDIPERYDIVYVIALGKPSEKVVLEDIGEDGDIRYYRDADDVHHVPKRKLDEIVIGDVV